MTGRTFLTSLAIVLLTLTTSFAQLPSPVPESKEEKEKAQKELERKALTLLEETLAATQMLKLAENRSLIESQAADLLWKRDEKRARALFREAMTDLGTALSGTSEKGTQNYWMLVQARVQILQMIATRDPHFALEMLRASSPPQGDTQGFGRGDQELTLEQSITAQVAADDPKLALKMAQESLDKGVTFSIFATLQRLQQKDSEAASQLLTDIVKKLQSENLASKPESSFVALELLRVALRPQSQQETSGARASSSQPAVEIKPLKFEEQTTRDLADLVINAALKPGLNGPGMLMQVQPLMPDLEKLSPTRATQLRSRITELDKTLDPQSKAWMQFGSLMRGGSTDAILEAAAKSPPEMRSSMYSSAAWKLMQAGETDRARQIISENLSGQEREQALARLDHLVILRAIEKGKLEEVKQIIAGIRSKERRASALAQLAIAVAAKGDKKGALQILDDARASIDRQPDNDKELEALLEVARGYALVEPARTFELLDPLIDQANEMLSAAALLEKFGARQGLFRKGEMLMMHGFASMGGPYAHFIKALTELSRVSFDRTRASADRFSRDEVRLMARLIIAQSVLTDRPQKSSELEGMEQMGFGTGVLIGY